MVDVENEQVSHRKEASETIYLSNQVECERSPKDECVECPMKHVPLSKKATDCSIDRQNTERYAEYGQCDIQWHESVYKTCKGVVDDDKHHLPGPAVDFGVNVV